MKKYLLLSLVFLIACTSFLSAQKTITGTVKSAEDGSTLPGTTVLVKGTTIGTITNIDGKYTLQVPEDKDTLVFSFVGMQTQQRAIGDKTSIDVVLSPEVSEIEEVVVTAMGIKREKKALGYATQNLEGDKVSSTGEEDVAKALQGKIAGVTVKQTSGMPGAGSNITIRGSNAITLSNQPLYVVDGMPIESGNPYQAGTGGANFSNRSLDINPDDIESVNVLKGPTAAALYGLRASNGVVVITTKSGKAAKKAEQKTIVTINTGFTAEKVSRLPNLQDQYAQGVNDSLDLLSPYSWGPEISSLPEYQSQDEYIMLSQAGIYNIDSFPINGQPTNTPQAYDNVTPFFQTGYSFKNSFDISTSSEIGSYSIGMGATNQSGIIPTTGMEKYNAKFNGMFDLNDKVNLGVSANYANIDIDKVPSGNDQANPIFSVYSAPVSYDLTDKAYENTDNPYIQKHYRKLLDNPYWALDHNKYYEKTQRFFGNMNLLYDPWDWLNVSYRLGIDMFSNKNNDIVSLGSGNGRAYPLLGKPEPDGGQIHNRDYNYHGINSTLLLTFDKKVSKDIRTELIVGNEIYDNKGEILEIIGNELQIGGFENVSATANQLSSQTLRHKRGYAFFSTLTFDYKAMFFINPSGRFDVVSNMPEENRTFFYPSVSSSLIFTKLSFLENNNILDYGKLRASYAQVGQDGDLYSTRNYFGRSSLTSGMISSYFTFPYNDQTAFSHASTLYTSELVPQNTKTIELGTDLRFFNNRIAIDYTFYLSNADNQIYNVPIAPATGYETEYRNAGQLRTTGHEAILTLKFLKSENYSWDFITNFTTYDNKVVSLAEGVERIATGANFTSVGTFAYEGEAFPVIFGTTYMRDEEGNIMVDGRETINGETNPAYGMPIQGEQEVLAKVDPDFEMSFINSIRYKSATLSFQFDWRKGGHMWSGSNSLLDAYGMSEKTENRDAPIVVDGVMAEKDQDDNWVASGDNNIEIEKDRQKYYYDEILYNITEAYIYKTTFVRLREVTIDYQLPKKWFSNTIVRSAKIYFSGRNLLLITDYPNFDPESSTSSGNGAGGFEYVSLPNTKSFGGGLRLTF